jgi:hypothetical protein
MFAVAPGWTKNQKTSKGTPINNRYLYTDLNRVIWEDGAGDGNLVTPRIREYTDAEKKEIADALIAVFGGRPNFKKVADATVNYNCHGLTFNNRAFALGTVVGDVESILQDQGWTMKAEEDAKVGDIVVYKRKGKVTHTGVILAVGNGVVTKVLSKWGQLPEFEHAPRDVPNGQDTAIGKLPRYGIYEVWSGGKPLPPPPPEFLSLSDEEAEPWPANIAGYSIAPVDTVSTSNPSTVHVGETFQVQIQVTGEGVGSFLVPISFVSSGAELFVFPYTTYPPQDDLKPPITDMGGYMTITATALEPGQVNYTVTVVGDGTSGGGSLQVLP